MIFRFAHDRNLLIVRRALLYGTFSILPFLVDLGVVFLLREQGVSNVWSFVIAAFIGTVTSFLVNKLVVFGQFSRGRIIRESSLFLAMSVAAVLIGMIPGVILDIISPEDTLLSVQIRTFTLVLIWAVKFFVLHFWIFPRL